MAKAADKSTQTTGMLGPEGAGPCLPAPAASLVRPSRATHCSTTPRVEVAPAVDHHQEEGVQPGCATVEPMSWRADELKGRLAAALEELRQLSGALERSRDIGAAIGILMVTHRVTRETAFKMLCLVSSHQNRKVHVVAGDVVTTGDLPL